MVALRAVLVEDACKFVENVGEVALGTLLIAVHSAMRKFELTE